MARAPDSLLGILSSFREPKALRALDNGDLSIRASRGELLVRGDITVLNNIEGEQVKVFSGFKGRVISKAINSLFDLFENRQVNALFADLQRSVSQFKPFSGLSDEWKYIGNVEIETKLGHLKVVAFPSKYDDRDTSWTLKVFGRDGKEVNRLVLPYDSPLDYFFSGKFQASQIARLGGPKGIVIDYDKAYRDALTPPEKVSEKKSRPTGLLTFLRDVTHIELHQNHNDRWIVASKDPSFFGSMVRITADGRHCLFENEEGSHRLSLLTSKAVFRYLEARLDKNQELKKLRVALPEGL